MYVLLALAHAEPFVIQHDERHHTLIDHNATVTTCILAIDPADMCTNTNNSSFHLLTCRKYDSTASGLNIWLSLSSMNRAPTYA
jgi:hypothetical protein